MSKSEVSHATEQIRRLIRIPARRTCLKIKLVRVRLNYCGAVWKISSKCHRQRIFTMFKSFVWHCLRSWRPFLNHMLIRMRDRERDRDRDLSAKPFCPKKLHYVLHLTFRICSPALGHDLAGNRSLRQLFYVKDTLRFLTVATFMQCI